MRKYNYDIVRKWSPVIAKKFGVDDNSEVCKLICHRVEKAAIRNLNNFEMTELILEIKEKLKDRRFNKKIVGEYINILTNKKGYILEGGGYYVPDEEMSYDDIIYLVGIDVLKEIDPKGFRDNRIESVINEEN